jgi:hypothetical protein
MSTPDKLLADDWREYPDQFRKYARCFYKRFDTPTRCACNDDKAGMQICFAVSEYEGVESIEADICGELPDGTWVKIMQHGLPKDLAGCLAVIPRMLATWESISNYKPL